MVVADDQRNIKVEQSADGSAVVSGDHNHIDQSRTVNIHYHLPEKQPAPNRNDRNETILIKAVWAEVQDRLKQSLHNAVLLTLGKTEQRDQVGRPWDSQLRTASQSSQPLPPETPIAEVFDRDDINGKLLILGNPGAGKTTTLLDLAAVLVQRANGDPTQPIPVLFNLSSWQDDKQTLKDWLLGELKLKYGVSPKLGQQWLEARTLLPLLDGLDELPPQRQEPAVQRINDWLQSGEGASQLVVCSRREEYELYATKLSLNGAICLEPLTEAQLATYFATLGMEPLWDTVRHDPDFLELVRTPLLLSVSILANDNIDPVQWQRLTTPQERLGYLLDAYIRRQLHTTTIPSRIYPPKKQPTPQQTRHWLSWLAQQLQAQSEDEFLIEKMQPLLLKSRIKYTKYILIFLTLRGLALAIGLTIFMFLFFCLRAGLLTLQGEITSLLEIDFQRPIFYLMKLFFPVWVAGFLATLIIHFDSLRRINTVENLSFDLKSIAINSFALINRSFIISGIIKGSVLGLLFSTCAYFFGNPLISEPLSEAVVISLFSRDFSGIFMNGFVFGAILGFCLSFSHGIVELFKSEMTSRIVPNHGIIKSFRNIPILLLLIAIINTLVLYLLGSLSSKSFYDSSSLILFGLGISPFLLVFSPGSLPGFQHLSLRIVLCFSSKIPWNYARFLNHCTERLLLQRVGGRYRFIHRLVQERFAATGGHRLQDS